MAELQAVGLGAGVPAWADPAIVTTVPTATPPATPTATPTVAQTVAVIVRNRR